MFNEDELIEQVDGDVQFLSETAEMLATDGPDLAAQIRAAILAGDAAAVGRLAHTLKGMVSNFCAAQTQGLATELEQAGKAGDLGAAASLIARLESNLGQLTAELGEFIRART